MKIPRLLVALAGLVWAGTAHAGVKVGDKAPDVSAPLSDGTTFRLSDWLNKGPLVLYFYPKNDTPGCTMEACGLRDDIEDFRNLKVNVVGASFDSVASHKKFIEKYKLPFPLIADTEKTVAKAFGVSRGLFAARATFIIGRDGTILYANTNVKPASHSRELREALGKLK